MDDLSQKLFDLVSVNGGPYWTRSDGNIYNPIGFSTIDILNVLADLGLTIRNTTIHESVTYIWTLYDEKKKSFRYAPKSNKLPCINAKILSLLSRLGNKDERIKDAAIELMKNQQSDGGWRCPTVEVGKSPETDASNPGTTLYVLDLMKEIDTIDRNSDELNSAVMFLLNHWITRKPLGPCGFGIGSIFQKPEYPFYRYNIFYYLYVLSFYHKARKDERFNEIMSVLQSKKNDKGIIIENQHKKWKDLLFTNTDTCILANQKYTTILKNLP